MSGLDVATITICGGGVVWCLFFIVAYHLRTHGAWRRSPIGWYLMLGPADLSLILALTVSVRMFGDWPGRRILVLVLFSFYVCKLPWLTALMWRVTGSKVEGKEDVYGYPERADNES